MLIVVAVILMLTLTAGAVTIVAVRSHGPETGTWQAVKSLLLGLRERFRENGVSGMAIEACQAIKSFLLDLWVRCRRKGLSGMALGPCRAATSFLAGLRRRIRQNGLFWWKQVEHEFSDLKSDIRERLAAKPKKESPSETWNHAYAPVDLAVLNCRARIGRQPQGDDWQSVIIVEICGTIEAPDDEHEVDLEVGIVDVTDGPEKPVAVLTRPKHGSIQQAEPFQYRTGMGKLCHRTSVLEDWTAVAQLSPEWFVLGRQGHRDLQYNLSLVSQTTGDQLAAATCVAPFEAVEIGYLDIEDNIERARTLAVGLAFNIAMADDTLSEAGVDVIHDWVGNHFGTDNAEPAAKRELERALQKTAAFFQRGGRLNLADICTEIAEIAPMVGRLEILNLCLTVTRAKGQVTATELALLRDLSNSMQIDPDRFRAMVDKTLPIEMHGQQDPEMVLGVSQKMDPDDARRRLNREYAKWSSRVISSDPAIRNQADQMLKLIAEARTQFVSAKCSP